MVRGYEQGDMVRNMVRLEELLTDIRFRNEPRDARSTWLTEREEDSRKRPTLLERIRDGSGYG